MLNKIYKKSVCTHEMNTTTYSHSISINDLIKNLLLTVSVIVNNMETEKKRHKMLFTVKRILIKSKTRIIMTN